MKEEVVLGLGSNMADREGALRSGLTALAGAVDVLRVSSVYSSRAIIHEDQPDFLNLVALGRTHLSPNRLLRLIHSIETAAGRERSFRGAPRPLDIDILFLGSRIIRTAELTIPHPGWRTRAFVLLPLIEIAPDWVDPDSGLTVREVAAASPDAAGAEIVGPAPVTGEES